MIPARFEMGKFKGGLAEEQTFDLLCPPPLRRPAALLTKQMQVSIIMTIKTGLLAEKICVLAV